MNFQLEWRGPTPRFRSGRCCGAARWARRSPCGLRQSIRAPSPWCSKRRWWIIVSSTATVLRRRRLPFPRFLAGLVVRRAGKLAGMRIDRPGPLKTAPSVTCPTVIIHGMDDLIVPREEARRLADAFPLQPHWFDVAGAKHIDVIDKGGEPLLEQIAAVLEKAAADRGDRGTA